MGVRQTIRQELKTIANYYGVKIKFTRHPDAVSPMSADGEVIHIALGDKSLKGIGRDFIINSMFHELGHVYCYRNGLFVEYHNVNNTYDAIIRTALKAERYVDRWAGVEVLKYRKFRKEYIGVTKRVAPYDYVYSDPRCVKWFRQNFSR